MKSRTGRSESRSCMQFEIQAHRGARAFFPENTLPAFRKAADLGVRVIELDVVVSADHRLVVSHDPWIAGPLCTAPDGTPLDLLEDDRYIMYRMEYAEIAAFGCGLPDPAFPFQQEVDACKPLLSEVFCDLRAHMQHQHLSGTMMFNIELKSWPEADHRFHPPPAVYAGIVTEQLLASGMTSNVRVQSFDRRLLEQLWLRAPDLCYGMLVDDVADIEPLPFPSGFVPVYVNPCLTLLAPELLDRLHRSGVRVVPWTVNRSEEMYAMKQMGADGIITDHPELAMGLPGLFS